MLCWKHQNGKQVFIKQNVKRNRILFIFPHHHHDIKFFHSISDSPLEQNTSENLLLAHQKKRFKRGYWRDMQNCEKFLNNIGKIYNIKTYEDWYTFNPVNLGKHKGGLYFLKIFGSSFQIALKTIYPNYEWDDFKFIRKSKNFWCNPTTGRRFFDYIYKKHNFKSLDDFYSISINLILQNKGKSLVNKSKFGIFALLKKAYPEHNWDLQTSQFRKTEIFNSVEYKKNYLLFLIKTFQINRIEDWYRISSAQLNSIPCGRAVIARGGLFPFLSSFYPSLFRSSELFIKFAKKSTSTTINYLFK